MCNFVSNHLNNFAQGFYLCSVAWSLLDNTAHGFYLCNVVPRVLRQHWTLLFPAQCCLEPLGHHCTRILPMQWSPKSIKTTLSSISSSAMLSGASWTTLHKDFNCAMLFQEYYGNTEQFFFLRNFMWSLLVNIAQSFYRGNVIRSVLRHQWTGFFSVQYCAMSIKTTLKRIVFLI